MTSVKLTSDGYSFHTMELKVHPDGKAFSAALKLLCAAAQKSKDPRCRTYSISKYWTQSAHPHCSTMLSGTVFCSTSPKQSKAAGAAIRSKP